MDLAQVAEQQTSEHRRFGRRRVMLSARLLSIHGESSVALLDLSEGGAMLNLPLPLPKGAHVVLIRGDFEAHATIAWAEGRRVGVQFDEPITEEEVDAVISPGVSSAH